MLEAKVSSGFTMYEIEIIEEWCKACELCVVFCPWNVLEADIEGRPRVVRIEACTNCKLCEMHCPDFAIEVKEVEPAGSAAR